MHPLRGCYKNLELFASDKQHVLGLYCSKRQACCYKLYLPSFGMAYGNPSFSELANLLTKVAPERPSIVVWSPNWRAHGGNEYWHTPLQKLTMTSIQLPDDAIYVPLGRKTPIGKPGRGSMLSVVDGSLAPVSWEDPDPALVQEIQRESSGYTLDVLKERRRPRDAVETTPREQEYMVSDGPCQLPNPDVVSECGLSELPSSIPSDDKADHNACFLQTCVQEVENAKYATPQKPLFCMRGKGPCN